MKRWCAVAFVLAGIPLTGIAAESFEFKQIAACDSEHDPYSPDRLLVERDGERLVATVWAGISCGLSPVEPDVIPDWGTVTLKLAFKADGPVATCRCTAKVQFLLDQDVPTGRTIYFVKDGNGAAHAIAP